ncbi:hypothetical protein MYX75_04975 [Acidobacteria bacterium AH-259-A15]|nr:hypothetical protein [Acidobacteria bacterium AH-259-A15]
MADNPYLLKFKRLLAGRDLLDRLQKEITQYETRLDALEKQLSAKESQKKCLLDTCRQYVEKAKDALQRCKIDEAWASLNEAERVEVGLLDPAVRKVKVTSLREECKTKLKSWRKAAAGKLLPTNSKDVSIDAMREALWHRNTHSENEYFKIRLLNRQLFTIGLFVIGVLVLMYVLRQDFRFLSSDSQATFIEFLPVIILAGLLGGTLSAAISVTRAKRGRKIPEVRRSFKVTLIRPFVGAGSAVAVYFFLRAGLIAGLIGPIDNWKVVAFCLLAGFSEQWFLQVVKPPKDEQE